MIAKSDIRQKAVILLAAISLFAFLGSRGLNEPDEGRFAETSREMSLQDSWLVPHLCGVPHLQKPPLIYWVTAVCIKAFGANEWAARIPSALAALGTVILTMYLAGQLYGPGVSWKSGLILLTSGLFFILARIITTDMMLTFWITAAITAFVDYAKRGRKLNLLVFYICLGLGFLTKGPMAFLVPFSAVIPFAIAFSPDKKDALWRWHWIPGFILALSIGLSWYLLLINKYPELLNYFYQYELIDRVASDTHNRSQPIWFYTVVFLSGFLPWTILFPGIWKDLWAKQRTKNSFRTWLFAGWIVIPWVFLHLVVSKLATYVLPLFPAFAILSAYILDKKAGSFRIESRIISVCMIIVTASIPFVCNEIAQHYDQPIPLSGIFLTMLVVLIAGWICLFALTGTRLNKTKSFLSINILLLVTMLTLSLQTDTILVGSSSGLRQVAEAVKAEQLKTGPGDVYVYNGRRYSMEFYLQRPLIRSWTSIDLSLPIPQEVAHRFVANREEFLAANRDPNLLIIVKGSKEDTLLENGWVPIFEHHGVTLLKRGGVN